MPGSGQNLLLTLRSGITPGRLRKPHGVLEIETGLVIFAWQAITLCTISPVPILFIFPNIHEAANDHLSPKCPQNHITLFRFPFLLIYCKHYKHYIPYI